MVPRVSPAVLTENMPFVRFCVLLIHHHVYYPVHNHQDEVAKGKQHPGILVQRMHFMNAVVLPQDQT